MACSKKCGIYSLFTTGSLFILIFSIFVVFWPSLYFSIFKQQMILSESSYSYGMWKETPIPIQLELFLYNFTNSDDVFKDPDNVIPHFEEKGPYVFHEHHIKTNITWHDNGTVTFLQRRIWHFDEKNSVGDLSDQITNINIVAVTAAYFTRGDSLLVRFAINSALKLYSEGVVVTKSARELLFDGYSDKLLNVINALKIPGMSLPFDKFGWFYGRNESDIYDGWWTIHTGANDINRLGDMDLWNFNNHTNYYDGQCSNVKGTTGELFPPRTDPQEVTVFASDICSYMTLNYANDTEVEGIKGKLFKGENTQFDNGHHYPESGCFCKDGGVCPPAGARNVSLCKFGAPAFVSYPHFYLADQSYLSKISGLVPDPEKDSFEMVLEPETGIPLYVRAQLQINIFVQRIPQIKLFNSMPDKIYIPVLWFRQSVQITEDLASQAKLALSMESIISYVLYALIGVGVLLLLTGILLISFRYPLRRSESESNILEE